MRISPWSTRIDLEVHVRYFYAVIVAVIVFLVAVAVAVDHLVCKNHERPTWILIPVPHSPPHRFDRTGTIIS